MKVHFAVRIDHTIEATVMTAKDVMDDQVVGALCEQIAADIGHVTADKMYAYQCGLPNVGLALT